MNTTTSRGLIRFLAGPVAAASIIGGALGLAAVANATTAAAPAVAAFTAPTVGRASADEGLCPHGEKYDPSTRGCVPEEVGNVGPASAGVAAAQGGETGNAGGLMQATHAGGLMQPTNAGGLMQPTTPKAW